MKLQVQQALEQTQFALSRETARRARLDKKYGELEARGRVSPRSVPPNVIRSEALGRTPVEPEMNPLIPQSPAKAPSARCGVCACVRLQRANTPITEIVL